MSSVQADWVIAMLTGIWIFVFGCYIALVCILFELKGRNR